MHSVSVLQEPALVVSLLGKRGGGGGTPLLCDPGRVDLLYVMTPGETGFVVEVSVWNAASARCHKRFGERDKSPNHILEHLNSPLSLPGCW